MILYLYATYTRFAVLGRKHCFSLGLPGDCKTGVLWHYDRNMTIAEIGGHGIYFRIHTLNRFMIACETISLT